MTYASILKRGAVWIGALVLSLAVCRADAQSEFTYQGELAQAGEPADGAFDMTFALFDADSGGAQVGATIAIDDVAVAEGRFSVQLDFGASSFAEPGRWLEITVDGFTLTPRQPVTASPFSIKTRGIVVDDAENVGIGTPTPETKVHIVGDIRAEGGLAMGNNAFFNSGEGGEYPEFARIYDFSTTITDFSESFNWSPMLSVYTLDPLVDLPITQNYVNSFEGHTAVGNAQNLAFLAGLTGGAVHNGSGTVANLFGSFLFSGPDGPGHVTRNYAALAVAGVNNEGGTITDNYGIDIFTGVFGDTGSIENNYGLFVQSPSADQPIANNYGVYIEDQDAATGINYALYNAGGDTYHNGDVEIIGTVSKGGGSFKIDHPLDPANKFLYHSFVESPDMMNIYNGTVTTDALGYATVAMPDWFEALNRDFRYQLTVIDAFDSDAFVLAKVVREMENGVFTIRTSAPRTKVSWQVTGIRRDAFANANRIPTEVDKAAGERGRFLHPELFGLPSNMRIGWTAPREKLDARHNTNSHGGTR